MNNRPTKASNRIDLLDVYRGFAILGIFVVNIVIMNSTFLNQDVFAKQWTSNIDQIAERILQLFFYTKFFPIFSLLFGLGISMQAIKLLEKNNLSFSFFIRRMLILFLIGVLHIVLLWSGDVLNIYAIIGLFTTLLINRSNRLILVLSLAFLLFPFYDQLLEMFFGLINFNPGACLANYSGESVNQIIKFGSYVEGLVLRVCEYKSNSPMLFGYLGPVAISMFLLGLYLGKNNIQQSLENYIHRIRKPMIIFAIATNIYRLLFLFILPDYEIYRMEFYRPIFIKLMVISDIVMGIFYLWLIGWLWYNTKLKSALSILKYAGRMALTNYIMQSVIGLLIFSSLGLRLYETLSPSQTLFMAIGIFIIQLIYSKIWLTYFRFGPLEWLWRCLTYMKFIPIKK